PARGAVLAVGALEEARGADVDDGVVDLDRLVRREGLRRDVEFVGGQRLVGGKEGGAEADAENDGERSGEHGGTKVRRRGSAGPRRACRSSAIGARWGEVGLWGRTGERQGGSSEGDLGSELVLFAQPDAYERRRGVRRA